MAVIGVWVCSGDMQFVRELLMMNSYVKSGMLVGQVRDARYSR